jgi:MSHA biogenesis protein MshJ
VEARSFDLYRHGVEIRLEGSFAELQAYLVQLEALQKRLLWGQLQYRVTAYPTAEMSLMVYTLSPDRTWLAL